jgi:ribulose-phosphate 3-epimerase
VAQLRALLDVRGALAQLQIDGGIGADNAAAVAQAGATVLVAGSAVFGGGRGIAANLRALQAALG